MKRLLLLVVAVVVLAAGCSSGGDDEARASATTVRRRAARVTTSTSTTSTTAAPTTVPAPPPAEAVPVRVAGGARIPVVAVYDQAGGRGPRKLLRNPTHEGYRLSFLVEESRPDGWVRVSVPARPNGWIGWVQASDLELYTLQAKVVIELRAHRLRYWDGDRLLLDEPIAVGTAATPTPPGNYFVDIVAKPPNPRGAYGPYQVSITAFSNVLERFAGGIGQLAIHGTNRPDLIGRNVSNGCIRVRNSAITILAENVVIGTPVEIRP